MENQLPREIIHRIQSFMNGKEAARTTILSKYWCSAWSTRPNLHCDQRHFPCNSEEELFEFAKKTMQRYEDLNLKIDTLRLLMLESHDVSLAKELMVKAMKLGAVDLDITSWNPSFVLPDEVLRSKSLATLSLTGSFTIDLVYLTCSKLKSLSLSVTVKCDLVIRDLISRFPSLKILKFDGGGKRFRPFSDDRINPIEGECDKLDYVFRRLTLEFHKLEFVFQKLEHMYLGHLNAQGNLFADASVFSKFPFLKELVIWDCHGLENIRIYSGSLERISIGLVEERRSFITELDVPNIRKFKFEGCGWCRLALNTSCTKWESDIRVTCGQPNAEWFVSLNELLKKLSSSKVSLFIKVTEKTGDCSGSVRLRPYVVENLTLEGCAVTPTFLDNIFWICRPKLIIREYCSLRDPVNEYLFELVCKRVVEEVNAEVYEEFPPWKTYLDDRRQFVRFQLRWGLLQTNDPSFLV